MDAGRTQGRRTTRAGPAALAGLDAERAGQAAALREATRTPPAPPGATRMMTEGTAQPAAPAQASSTPSPTVSSTLCSRYPPAPAGGESRIPRSPSSLAGGAAPAEQVVGNDDPARPELGQHQLEIPRIVGLPGIDPHEVGSRQAQGFARVALDPRLDPVRPSRWRRCDAGQPPRAQRRARGSRPGHRSAVRRPSPTHPRP